MTGWFALHRRLMTWIVLGGAALLAVVAIALAVRLVSTVPAGDSTSPPPSLSPSAEPSATAAAAEPSASMSQSPQVTPTPNESPGAQYRGPFAAIVLVNDLRVRSEPGLSGTPIAAFQADDVVQIVAAPVEADGQQWFNVQGGDNRVGWISAGPPADPYLDLRSFVPINVPGAIRGVAAGANGFLAWGWESQRSDEEARPVLLASSDGGAAWRRAPFPAEAAANIVSAAWGSSGWMIVTADATWTAAGTFWQSNDGVSWTRLPNFGNPGIVPESLVASPMGYLMTVVDIQYGDRDSYFSADGQAWRRIVWPNGPWSSGSLAVPNGFLLWMSADDGTGLVFATDFDILTSSGEQLPGSAGDQPMFAVAGSHVIGVLTDQATGVQSIWRSSLPNPTLAWVRQTAAEATMAETAIAALVSDGSTLLLSGYDRSNATPRLWRSTDGSSWSEVPGAALFGGAMPSLVAGSEAGFVGVGRVMTPAGANPVMWHSANGLGWSGETDPVLGLVHSSVADDCPALPETQIDWLAIPGSVAAECFGDTSITITGWLTVGGGCGGFSPGTFEPEWLAAMYATYQVIVTPFEAEYGGCGSAARHPTLASLPEPQQWVTVTGHYDDPAASTCRWLPDPLYARAYTDPATLVERCRTLFVATQVAPVGN